MGADVHCSIGRRDQEEYISVLGMNRFDGSNTRGDKFMEIYGSNNLRVYNTFYTHDNYITYVSKGIYKTPSMHDIFSIAKTTPKRIRGCKAVNNGAEIYHEAVEIKLAIMYIKFKHNKFIEGVADWMNIANY